VTTQNGGEKTDIIQKLFSGKLIKEYSFTNKLKMMGHVWKQDEKITVSAKGAPESILSISNVSEEEKIKIQDCMNKMSSQGMRVIAVGTMEQISELEIPENITDCKLNFCGLIGLVDPPREEIKESIEVCNKAGIRVIMITGDNVITAKWVAKKVGIKNADNTIIGEEIDKMTDEELKECVKNTNIFSRVIPEHKMRIVKALKENGEIVAMTGDGVNDAPALKYADIGIAMGKRGSEVSREAADLILLDDNFTTIVDTIKDGRRIYDNIRKAIGYVFAIHIPIVLSALLAPLLHVNPAALLILPVTVVLLELFVDPTCSVVLERQPAESNIMNRNPRNPKENILSKGILIKSIIQGVVIFAFSFGIYYLNLSEGAEVARTMGICSIILANLFLVFENSSEIESVIVSTKRLLKDKVMWAIGIATVVILFIVVYTPVSVFLKLSALSLKELATLVVLSFVSVFWYEIVKMWRKK